MVLLHWQMIQYDGRYRGLHGLVLDKKRWMNDYSVVVDCMYTALGKGGIVKKYVVDVFPVCGD